MLRVVRKSKGAKTSLQHKEDNEGTTDSSADIKSPGMFSFIEVVLFSPEVCGNSLM